MKEETSGMITPKEPEEKEDLLTVSEFATAAGITTQAVYKRLPTTLQPYIRKRNGKTLIHKEALKMYGIEPLPTVTNGYQPEVANRYQPLPTAENERYNAELKAKDDLIQAMQKTIDLLNDQIQKKDGQLERKDEQIQEYNERLKAKESETAALLDRLKADGEALLIEQKLHAGTIQKSLLEAPETGKGVEDPEPIRDETRPRNEKTGIFSRLFKKGK